MRAINDIRKAFDVYKEAKIGLIITTANEKGKEFDEELDRLIMETGKDVGVILGNDLVKLFMKYGTY